MIKTYLLDQHNKLSTNTIALNYFKRKKKIQTPIEILIQSKNYHMHIRVKDKNKSYYR